MGSYLSAHTAARAVGGICSFSAMPAIRSAPRLERQHLGIDPRAGRVPFTVAPSVHRRGGRYQWLVAPWELDPPVAPEWLLQQLAPPPPPLPLPKRPAMLTDTWARRRVVWALNWVLEAIPGQRNATLNRQAFTLGRFVGAGMVDESASVIAVYQAARCVGLDDSETRATIRSGFEAGLKQPFSARSDG